MLTTLTKADEQDQELEALRRQLERLQKVQAEILEALAMDEELDWLLDDPHS
jgi:hypothetical protein